MRVTTAKAAHTSPFARIFDVGKSDEIAQFCLFPMSRIKLFLLVEWHTRTWVNYRNRTNIFHFAVYSREPLGLKNLHLNSGLALLSVQKIFTVLRYDNEKYRTGIWGYILPEWAFSWLARYTYLCIHVDLNHIYVSIYVCVGVKTSLSLHFSFTTYTDLKFIVWKNSSPLFLGRNSSLNILLLRINYWVKDCNSNTNWDQIGWKGYALNPYPIRDVTAAKLAT